MMPDTFAANSLSAARECPACGGSNQAEAVFCANPNCRHSLGEFRYVGEEMQEQLRWHDVLVDKVAGFIGKPTFLAVHAFWFSLWIALNAGILGFMHGFDAYPYSLLGILLSIEAIFITGFLLISQNRQSAYADKRAELDYEVNVRTYRKIAEMEASLDVVLDKLQRLEAVIQSKTE